MMALLRLAQEQGLELHSLGRDRLRVVCHKQTPRSVQAWVTAHKTELLAALEEAHTRALLLAKVASWPAEERLVLLEELVERAAILEFEGGLEREAAERTAADLVWAKMTLAPRAPSQEKIVEACSLG